MDLDWLPRIVALDVECRLPTAEMAMRVQGLCGVPDPNWKHSPSDVATPARAGHRRIDDPPGLLRSLASRYAGCNVGGHII